MYNKYHNKKIETNGIIFDSVKEYRRFNELKLLEKAGVIKNLELQKKFLLQPSYTNIEGKHIREISYIADFYYIENGKEVVEDVKSPATRTQVYLIKKKMFEYKYDLVIKEL